jgi:hypothetical protein
VILLMGAVTNDVLIGAECTSSDENELCPLEEEHSMTFYETKLFSCISLPKECFPGTERNFPPLPFPCLTFDELSAELPDCCCSSTDLAHHIKTQMKK